MSQIPNTHDKIRKKRKKSGLPVKEQDAKVSVPVVETQARIDDRERRPPLLTKRWRERKRVSKREREWRGREKKATSPLTSSRRKL